MEELFSTDLNLEIEREHTFIHIHNPKSAGSMFNKIIRNNFKTDAIEDRPLVSYKKYSKEDMKNLFYLYPHKCFSSHNYSLASLSNDLGGVTAISFVRNPLDKLISSYFYLRNRDLTSTWHITKRKSLEELVDYMVTKDDYNPFLLDSSQVKWISGYSKTGLEKIKKALKDNELLLFPTDRFDESCVILEQMFPDSFKDCSYDIKINTSQKEYDIPDHLIERISRLEWFAEDIELYSLANENINALIETRFGKTQFEQKLGGFIERCDKKRTEQEIINTPPSSDNSLIRKIYHILFK